MAEEDELENLELEAFEEAIASGEGGEGDGEEMDPLAEEMLRMMEEEGDEDDSSSQEDVDRMMEMEMLKAMEEEGGGGGGGGFDMGGGIEGLGEGGGEQAAGGGIPPSIVRLMDVDMMVTIELGKTEMTLEDVLALGEQSLVELDKQVGEPIDVMVNGKPFAKGEVVTVSESFGVRITEIIGLG